MPFDRCHHLLWSHIIQVVKCSIRCKVLRKPSNFIFVDTMEPFPLWLWVNNETLLKVVSGDSLYALFSDLRWQRISCAFECPFIHYWIRRFTHGESQDEIPLEDTVTVSLNLGKEIKALVSFLHNIGDILGNHNDQRSQWHLTQGCHNFFKL